MDVSSFWFGLGYRQPGYKPTPQDYALYEDTRKRLLAEARGRAALMAGGIVWRLAYEDLAPGTVLLGPSPEAETRLIRDQ